LLGGRDANLIKFRLELALLDAPVTELPQRCLGVVLSPLRHQPARAFGEEKEGDRLDRRYYEEDSQRNTVRLLSLHEMRAVVDGCAHDGAGGELGLVYGKRYTSEMSWGHFVNVDLSEGEEPADRDALESTSY